eukprot:5227435-Amphidinium_carterae.1
MHVIICVAMVHNVIELPWPFSTFRTLRTGHYGRADSAHSHLLDTTPVKPLWWMSKAVNFIRLNAGPGSAPVSRLSFRINSGMASIPLSGSVPAKQSNFRGEREIVIPAIFERHLVVTRRTC